LTVFLAASAACQEVSGPAQRQWSDGRNITPGSTVRFKPESEREPGESGEPLFPGSAPGSGIYAEADALFLGRDNQSHNQPVVIDLDSPSGQDPILTTHDFQFPFEPALRARLGFPLNECLSFEVGYLGLFDARSGQTVTGDNNLAIPGDLGLASNVFFGADDMHLTYLSQLHSVELNCVKRCECCCCECSDRDGCGSNGSGCNGPGCNGPGSYGYGTPVRRSWHEWFAGFRYLRLTEEFNIRSTDLQEGSGNYNIQTSNDLYGAQIGTRWGRSRGRFGWELTGKAGLFGNACHEQQYATDFPPPFMLRPLTRSSGGQCAFVGELGVALRYQLTRAWALRGGYDLMWIEGVALAPDQLDFTDTPSSGSRLVSGGGVFLHGASVGMEARW
jgi:hypothetical protein